MRPADCHDPLASRDAAGIDQRGRQHDIAPVHVIRVAAVGVHRPEALYV